MIRVVELGAGPYATVIEMADGKAVRGKRFVLPEGAEDCTVVFSASAKKWQEDCK